MLKIPTQMRPLYMLQYIYHNLKKELQVTHLEISASPTFQAELIKL